MRLSRLILFLIFVLFTSAALAAKSDKTLVCHVGNQLGSNGETYQENAECDIEPPYIGDHEPALNDAERMKSRTQAADAKH